MGAALNSNTGDAMKIMNADEVADAREMALLLSEGEEMEKVQERLPRQLPHLTEDILWQLRESYDALIVRNPDVAPFVAVVAMNRVQRPWEALRLPMMISRQTSDALISKTDMGLVGEILFGRMDAMKAAIMAARHPIFDADGRLKLREPDRQVPPEERHGQGIHAAAVGGAMPSLRYRHTAQRVGHQQSGCATRDSQLQEQTREERTTPRM